MTAFGLALLEMVEGYRDGFREDHNEVLRISNRSEAYQHGWLNGRDDRMGSPRASYEALRAKADQILNSSTAPQAPLSVDEKSRDAALPSVSAPSSGQE